MTSISPEAIARASPPVKIPKLKASLFLPSMRAFIVLYDVTPGTSGTMAGIMNIVAGFFVLFAKNSPIIPMNTDAIKLANIGYSYSCITNR